jgi:hypothetical protein
MTSKVPGKADGTRVKGKGVVNTATAASALSSTQDNTVRVADTMHRLAPSRRAGHCAARWRERHHTALDNGSSCCGVWWAWDA